MIYQLINQSLVYKTPEHCERGQYISTEIKIAYVAQQTCSLHWLKKNRDKAENAQTWEAWTTDIWLFGLKVGLHHAGFV